MLEHTIEGYQCEGKKCSRCSDNTLKCYGMFFSNKARSDGLSVYCKDHDRAYRRAYRDAHRDKINMQAKERYSTPDQMAKKRLYYQEHRDQILQVRKEYASANADHIREYRRSPKVKERARIRARNRYHQPEVYQRIRAYRNRPEIKERERAQWQIYLTGLEGPWLQTGG